MNKEMFKMSNSPITKINNSNIPLRRALNRTISNPSIQISTHIHEKWQQRCEDVEQKRKNMLIEKEKLNYKYKDLERKYNDLQMKHEQLETELFEKNEELMKLTIASKNLYKEYEMLKNQYETETGAMARALKDASQWYKENKVLRRRTMLLENDTVDDGAGSDGSSSDLDIENLNKTIKQLSSEIAELQTDVDSLRHIEFQTTEENIKLSEELDNEKEHSKHLQTCLDNLQQEHEQILKIVELMKKEIHDLKKLEEDQRNNAVILRKKADEYQTERNVLAHRSMMLQEMTTDVNGLESAMLLEEIEHLKRTLENERRKHSEDVNMLQEKLDEALNNSEVEILHERLNVVETELQLTLKKLDEAEIKLKIPPPPPPPPLHVDPARPIVPLRVKRKSKSNVLEIAQTIGVNNLDCDTKKPIAGVNVVNDDIINAIKKGNFTLRKARQESKQDKEGTKAASEILNILGSLRRAPKKRQSYLSS